MKALPMRRFLAILICLCASAAPATTAAAVAPVRATVVVLWALDDPHSSSPDVRCMDVALRAPLEVGSPAKALLAHPGAHFAIAMSPKYASAFACAVGGDPLGAAWRATGERTDVRTRDVLALLANAPAPNAADEVLPGFKELA